MVEAMRAGLGARRRRHRPRRLRRGHPRDDPHRSDLRAPRRHPLRGRQHPRRGAAHLDVRAHQRDAPVPGRARRARHSPRPCDSIPRSRTASTPTAARSRILPSPKHSAWTESSSPTHSECGPSDAEPAELHARGQRGRARSTPTGRSSPAPRPTSFATACSASCSSAPSPRTSARGCRTPCSWATRTRSRTAPPTSGSSCSRSSGRCCCCPSSEVGSPTSSTGACSWSGCRSSKRCSRWRSASSCDPATRR